MASLNPANLLDTVLIGVQNTLETLCGHPAATRPNPAQHIPEADLSDTQKQLAARLMRVNHAGEVSAQALYQGQAWVAGTPELKAHLTHAAAEETDHLAWCAERIDELGGHTSYLNPIWYVGSLAIGVTAGLIGDKWSLGFVHETEAQVEAHLSEHLDLLPTEDAKSRKILEQMKQDEIEHGQHALDHGGAPLPAPIRSLMQFTSKLMTRLAYWV